LEKDHHFGNAKTPRRGGGKKLKGEGKDKRSRDSRSISWRCPLAMRIRTKLPRKHRFD
jgi:hypothetical protein